MITLEKIDQVVDRTGVTFAEAKKALEENGEDVIEAIISIEKGSPSKLKEDIKMKKDDLLYTLKGILLKGNATKIVVEKNEEIYLTIPMTVAIPTGVFSLALGPILVPIIAALGVGAYVGNVTVRVIKEDGSEVNVNKETQKRLKLLERDVNGARSKEKKVGKKVKSAVEEIAEDIEDDVIDITDDMMEKTQDKLDNIKDKLDDVKDKEDK